MKGWQIGVMVVMCVVFVVGVLLLCFLIYRFWGGVDTRETDEEEASKRTSARHERYEEVDHLEGGRGEGLVHVSDGYHFERYKLSHSDHILHYLDLQRNAKAVDFKKEARIALGTDLQTYLSRAEGMDDPETIGLTYVNAKNELVDMDLDLLIRRDDNFGQRMRHTADRPLLLGRLTEMVLGGGQVPAASTVTGGGAGGAGTPELGNPFANAARGVNVNVSLGQALQQQQQQPASAVVPPPCLFRPPSPSLGQGGRAGEPSGVFTDGTASAPAAATMLNSDIPPTPILFPSIRSHVTTRTPIFILAAQYVLRATNSALGMGGVAALDVHTTTTLEQAMAGELAQSIYLDRGAFAHHTATVTPAQGLATLQHPSGLRHEFVRRAAPVIKYSIDRTTSAQWTTLTGPFYLPPGRWCVRAKACTLGDTASSNVIAKVYTVNVV